MRSLPIVAAALLAAAGPGLAGARPGAPKMPAADVARLKARTVCSCLYVQGLSLKQCLDGESAIWRYPFSGTPKLVDGTQRLEAHADRHDAEVTLFEGGRAAARAEYFDDGGGCVTKGDKDVRRGLLPPILRVGKRVAAALPRAPLPAYVNAERLQAAIDEGFAPQGPLWGDARAVMIVHDGAVVTERYAAGYSANNRYYLGSVAKVFNNLLAGLLVRDGKLNVNEPVARPEWQAAGDARARITFDEMLHMTSGLDCREDFFTPGAPAYEIFFAGAESLDVAHYAASRPLKADPGMHFEYSTCAATLLGAALEARLGKPARERLLAYFSNRLFEPIGAEGIVPEFDAAGTFLGGYSVYARTEDLARIGLLLLLDGLWQGRQILPPGWVEYSLRPAQHIQPPASPYGAQLMLDMLNVRGCFGHAGVGAQKLIVCPRRGLVLVWFSSAFDYFRPKRGDPDELERRIVLAFPER